MAQALVLFCDILCYDSISGVVWAHKTQVI